MLVLSRALNQRIIINENICVEVVNISEGKVKIGIIAPKEISVHREEIHLQIKKNKIK